MVFQREGPRKENGHISLTSSDHIRVNGISKSFADRRVLTDISFTVSAGEPTAIIGENGTGKSALLRIVAGLEQPDSGSVQAPGVIQLYHQEPPFPLSFTVQDALDDATTLTRALVHEVTLAGETLAAHPEDTAASHRLEIALAEADRTDAWQLDHTVELITADLGLDQIGSSRIVGELSGGQRARLALAWTLLRQPHTLLLDEPTNHLDDRAAERVAAMIRDWKGPVLLASHDRAFIQEATTSIADLDPRPMAHESAQAANPSSDAGSALGVTRFTGQYSDYIERRADERKRWEEQYAAEQDELKRLRARVKADHQVGHTNWTPRSETRITRKFYADRNATVVSRRVNDARSSLETLEADQVRKPPKELSFRGLAPAEGASSQHTGALLQCSAVSVEGRLQPTSFSVLAGEPVLIEGANGSGKSTLLRVLAGTQEPTEGHVVSAPRVRVAMLGQDLAPLDAAADVTAAKYYRQLVGEAIAEAVPLSSFGLVSGRDENRRLLDLSVGQRRRVELATVLASPPDVLLLDEITNHFSLALVEEIERSIHHYPGGIVVASHDRMLRTQWVGPRIALAST